MLCAVGCEAKLAQTPHHNGTLISELYPETQTACVLNGTGAVAANAEIHLQLQLQRIQCGVWGLGSTCGVGLSKFVKCAKHQSFCAYSATNGPFVRVSMNEYAGNK